MRVIPECEFDKYVYTTLKCDTRMTNGLTEVEISVNCGEGYTIMTTIAEFMKHIRNSQSDNVVGELLIINDKWLPMPRSIMMYKHGSMELTRDNITLPVKSFKLEDITLLVVSTPVQQAVKMPKLGCIIMPPGHGKTYLQSRIEGFYEADTVYDCRGDDALKAMRSKARKSGDWSEYDKEWSTRLSVRLPYDRCVLMIPNEGIAKELGAALLAKVQLSDEQWAENLIPREKSIRHYGYSRLSGDGITSLETNKQVTEFVTGVVEHWIARN